MNEEEQISFTDCAIVACGTLSLELRFLKKSGFLDARKILYAKPGRHEDTKELESLLIKQIHNAADYSDRGICAVSTFLPLALHIVPCESETYRIWHGGATAQMAETG
jgi:hypothetical protein